MFSFDHLNFRYEPFPIGLAKPLVEDALYRELVAQYPPLDMFADLSEVGSKYSLSEKYNRRRYHQLIRTQPVWRELHGYIKSNRFIYGVLDVLNRHHLELGYHHLPPWKRFAKKVKKFGTGRRHEHSPPLDARFEFSMLPVDGGHVLPHTDSLGKVVTLVVSIVDENEWNPAYGGGTDINRPKDKKLMFNQLNRQATFDDMTVLDTFDFSPNQAVVFVRTFNSWHSVRPMTGHGCPAMRKSLTINIEQRR